MAEAYNDRVTFGREVIYTDVEEITAANVADVLEDALETHDSNRSDIQYLYDVYRGKADILNRQKTIRPEINNMVPVNYPYRIVRFKTGYNLGEPIQYVAKEGENPHIMQFNSYMGDVDKDTQDIELSDWLYIAGIGYRYINTDEEALPEEVPFKTTVLDPRYTFCVYDRKFDHKQKFCCTFSENEDGDASYYVYTDDTFFAIDKDGNVTSEPYVEVEQPIVEYCYNEAHLGAFEVVMSIINAINRVTSNRLDGIEQFIQSLMVFRGVNINADDYGTLREEGAILVPPDGDVSFLTQELNQGQTQTFVDALYQEMLEIVGMPNRNAGSSGGDNGVAVIYRDGWSDCESYAKSDEKMFKRGEKKFLRIALSICANQRGMDMKLSDININFTRRNYENIAAKAEVLTSMLGSDKIHPKLAFVSSGMFPDPETAWAMSREYAEEQENQQINSIRAEMRDANASGTVEDEAEVIADGEEEEET